MASWGRECERAAKNGGESLVPCSTGSRGKRVPNGRSEREGLPRCRRVVGSARGSRAATAARPSGASEAERGCPAGGELSRPPGLPPLTRVGHKGADRLERGNT